MDWNSDAQEKFNQMIDKVPVFLREVAKKQVAEKAETFAKNENRGQVLEKDMVNAFFEVTPFGFHGPMKTDMETIGIDYARYGHKR
jgi:hypothetical protein